MNTSIKFFLILINILNCYSFNIPVLRFNNKGSNICELNYNNVYSSFYKWSNENKQSQPKIIEDTLWLSKNRFINPTIIIGVYNDTYNLNYFSQWTGPNKLTPARNSITGWVQVSTFGRRALPEQCVGPKTAKKLVGSNSQRSSGAVINGHATFLL